MPLFLTFSVGFALFGCSKKAVDVVGKWKLNSPVPVPGAGATDETFAADHTISGIYGGTWSMAGDVVTIKISTLAGMPVDSLKSMVAKQPNGAAAAQLFDSMPLKADPDGKKLSLVDAKGNTSSMPTFVRD